MRMKMGSMGKQKEVQKKDDRCHSRASAPVRFQPQSTLRLRVCGFRVIPRPVLISFWKDRRRLGRGAHRAGVSNM